MSPFTAYLQDIGLETLALRVQRADDNALAIAGVLDAHERVRSVGYPGLSSSSYHDLAARQFGGNFGAILTFELADKKECFGFLNKLKLAKRATNIGDNATLAIHPASTIFVEYPKDERERMGVTDGLIRLTIGIEDIEDLVGDIGQALN